MSGRLAVDERLRELYDANGTLTADMVIEEARDPNSPIHDQFNWDVNDAAMEAWRETARRLIRTVTVVRTFEDITFSAKGRRAPEFIPDPSKDQRMQGYARAADLRNDHDRAMAALMYEIDRADSAINRARDVADALGLLDEVNIVSSSLSMVRKKAKGAA